jgi:hypothetical protein
MLSIIARIVRCGLPCVLTCLIALAPVAAHAQPPAPRWHTWGTRASVHEVFGSTAWDRDGPGPERPQLVAAGFAASSCGYGNVVRWDGHQWHAVGPSLNEQSDEGYGEKYLVSWDPDGDGPLTPTLVVAGDVESSHGEPLYGVARWDGTAWRAMGESLRLPGDEMLYITAMTTWDMDGAGPLPAELVAACVDNRVPLDVHSEVRRWDGSAWQPLGGQFDSLVRSLAVWDADGDGPAPARLVAGGGFSQVGDATANGVATWDGATWAPLGAGLGPADSWGGWAVQGMTTWDTDGDGPLPAKLVACGGLTQSGSTPLDSLAMWDGVAWQPVSNRVLGEVREITTWDQDGDGPQPERLVCVIGEDSFEGTIESWDGSNWTVLSAEAQECYHLNAIDPDGDGPDPLCVVAGGTILHDGAWFYGFSQSL